MTSTERILATLAGKPVDRRAAAPLLSLYGARLTGCPLETYYTDAHAYALGQTAVLETFQPDVLFAPFDFPALGAAFGSETRYFADQAPNIRRPAISSAADWPRIVMPDPDTHPRLVYFREAVREMVASLRGQAPVAVPLPAPIDLPSLIMGMDGWMETVLFDAPAAQRIMDELTPFFARLVNNLFADGAVFVALPCAFAAPAIVPREIVSRLMRPTLARILAQLHGPVVLHHGGTPMLAHLDLLAGLPPTIACVMDPQDDLDASRRIVGPDAVLFSGPLAPRMPGATAAQIGQQCRVLLENRGQDARFILCSTGPDIPYDTPPENIHALRQAAESLGAWP